MHIFSVVILLHLLDHFVYARLFEIILPEFKDSFISLLEGLVSQVMSRLPCVMGFERISEEVQTLEHHDVSRLRS